MVFNFIATASPNAVHIALVGIWRKKRGYQIWISL